MCVRRYGLAGGEGGFVAEGAVCGGDVVDPLLLRSDVLTLGPRAVVV
jgi:hypothetical protein